MEAKHRNYASSWFLLRFRRCNRHRVLLTRSKNSESCILSIKKAKSGNLLQTCLFGETHLLNDENDRSSQLFVIELSSL